MTSLVQMNNNSHWKEHHPVAQALEHRVSRREMAKFACLGVAACACAAVARPSLLPPQKTGSQVAIAKEDELAPGGSKLFRYPTEHHPAILIRFLDGSYAAYSQSCTHLMCPVHFDADSDQLVCPCHAGFFNARDGSVLAGPPPHPLPRFPVAIRQGSITIG